MSKADDLYEFASGYLVGGLCGSGRLNHALGQPFYITQGEGSKVYDLEGREYVDLHMSFGASFLGHGHPRVRAAIAKALDLGIICSHETPYHSRLAKKLVDILPCADLVRFTMSGTETTYYLLRLAREYTGKDKIVKFEGHFHGYHDYLQYNHSPAPGQGLPSIRRESGGVPQGLDELVIVLPFNDLERLEETLVTRSDEIAAVILEPINYNSGGILPGPGYLEAMRDLTTANDVVLIFDEILTAFRTGPGCAQAYLGVTPDLCAVGKALGGGMPISVFAGKREIMADIAPLGQAQHSGTYPGHLTAVMAANAVLDEITQFDFYEKLLGRCDNLYEGIREIIARTGVKCWLQAIGAEFCLLFGLDEEPTDYAAVAQSDTRQLHQFCAAALRHGIHFHSGLHLSMSSAHTKEDIDRALEGIEAAIREIV